MGANINAKNNNNDTPLHIAVQEYKPEIINSLVIRGADINAINNNGETPFTMGYLAKRYDMIEHFIKKGAKPDPLF